MQGYKSSIDMPGWLHGMGLNAYEYSCTRGVSIKQRTAAEIGQEAKRVGVSISIHAPYYINMATQDSTKRLKSKEYMMDAILAAQWMGATRVVFHPGACADMDRSLAMTTAVGLFKEVIDDARSFIDAGISFCPETMGKFNQLGTLAEIMELCLLHESVIPALDFGHLHALGRGAINSAEDYAAILDVVANRLGEERARYFHCHFSRVEYSRGGEKKHWALKDKQYGPEFEPLAEILAVRGLKPTIICESQGTMAEDALLMKSMYEDKLHLVK